MVKLYNEIRIISLFFSITVSYPVLDAPSLQLLCNCFSLDEAGMFALQMGFPLSIKEDLFKAQFPSKELANRLLRIWRGTRHSLDRIKK